MSTRETAGRDGTVRQDEPVGHDKTAGNDETAGRDETLSTGATPATGGSAGTGAAAPTPAASPSLSPSTSPHPPGPGPGPILVASDLDRTLIYSAAALALDMADALAPRLLCVEVYEHKPLSYLTETAAGLLEHLAREAVFVPSTTRTRAQYGRIRLPGPPAPYAVCANGGHLLVDGESDPGWQRRVRRTLDEGCAPLASVREHLLRSADPEWLLKERVAEDLFAYLVVDRALLPDAWVKDLADWADGQGWTVSLQGRKIYAVPKPLTKSAAVAEVARRTGASRVLTAGDSLLDADLLRAGDQAWRPGHGELADTGWTAPHVTALAERGVAAGEAILRSLVRAVAA